MIRISCILFFIAVLVSCDKDDCIEGEGSLRSEQLFTPAFSGLRIEGALDVRVEQGEDWQVVAIGHPNIIERLHLDVDDDMLEVRLESACFRDYELALEITMPSIAHLLLDGSGDVDMRDFLNNSDELNIEIEGSGDITIREVTGTEVLNVEVDGSGQVRGHESFPDLIDLHVEIEGSGDYHAYEIMTEHAVVEIRGSGDARLTATETLDVEIDGSGNVYYKGTPTISLDIDGSGDLINAN